MKKTLKERLESKLVPNASGCLEWTGYCDYGGYGRINSGRNTEILCHRAAWEVHNGSVPSECVLHRCDNPKCCNIDHLFLGTPSDNVQDMVLKGRQRSGGTGGKPHKVNEDVVDAVHQLRRESLPLREIAKCLIISESTVSRCLREKRTAR